MWLTGRLVPDHKTITDFCRDNGPAIRRTCAQFVELCRRNSTWTGDCVAIDGEPGSRRSTVSPERHRFA
jgi:transposase